MAVKPLPDQSLLNKLLRYDPDTGKLFWRERDAGVYANTKRPESNVASFNHAFADKEAFVSTDNDGYHQGWVLGQKTRAHRVIWKMMTGDEPEQIDHLNGLPNDNRFLNLAPSSQSENMRNLPKYVRNKSGCTGVGWHKSTGKWYATIRVDGTAHHLGVYADKDVAIRVRKAAERKFGFHPNHGR